MAQEQGLLMVFVGESLPSYVLDLTRINVRTGP